MADIRIKDLATTATTTASDDFMAVDGATNGTRKLNAAAPAFLTSVTTPSLTAPASTNLTLAAGSTNQSVILTPSGTGGVGIGTTAPYKLLDIIGVATENLLRVGNVSSTVGDTASIFLGVDPSINTQDVRAKSAVIHERTNDYGVGKLHFAVNSIADSTNASKANACLTIVGGNVGIGTTSPGAYRLNVAGGDVYVASSTAGSSNTGALVLTGGLSAGNNGNASYFGGAVSGAAATFRPASDGVGLTLNQANSASAGWSFSALNTGSLAVTRVGGVAAMTCDLNGSTTFYTSGTQTFGAVVISSGNTLKLGNAYVGGAAVGTGTITIQDSTGTTYRIPVLV